MASASSMECCKAFMSWVERFGVPRVAISDNGNSFIANLYKDIMRTFNIKVQFTPAYHAATNGAIERRHQTIKNSLKASLVDMGNHHGDKWTSALPWVLLGKRAALQPDLDASASMLAFGRSPELPGQLLGHPGPPLTTPQTKQLLEELYKLNEKPAIQTSATVDPVDISYTNNVTHVYVKVDEPRGLNPRFEGPYKVIDRPSRTTVTVRVGSFADGNPRLLTFNWSQCKPAHLRQNAKECERPSLGRRPNPPTDSCKLKSKQTPPPAADEEVRETSIPVESTDMSNTIERGKFQTPESTHADRSETLTSNPHPEYLRKGPLITKEMFQKWTPDLLGIPSTRPVRKTRNPNPYYVDSVRSNGNR